MLVRWTEKEIGACDAALVAVLARRGGGPAFDALDALSGGSIAAQAKEESFDGKEGRTLEWRGEWGGRTRRVVVAGLGERKADAAAVRDAVARCHGAAVRLRAPSASIYVDGAGPDEERARVGWAIEALHMAGYRFDAYRSKARDDRGPRRFSVGLHTGGRRRRDPGLLAAAAEAGARAEAVSLCRDLVNEPANELDPARLAGRARRVARERGLGCRVLGKAQLQKRGMGLVLAVAAGSGVEPRLVHLIYAPRKKPRRCVALVGKGVTFDSGGLCLKQAKSMIDMKTDMAGGALVLAAISAAAALSLDVEVHAIVPLAENGVGPGASRPGDVVRGCTGTTVEIVNTDCEGRMLLADALAYAGELGADEIVDFATLTGSCPVSLGPHRAGLLSNDDGLAARFEAAAGRAGELTWRLPLAEELDRDLRSDVADVKNAGGRFGGTITAALFLRRFVGRSTPWLHVDIAGPARADSATPLCPRGGTGYGVLSCLEFLARG